MANQETGQSTNWPTKYLANQETDQKPPCQPRLTKKLVKEIPGQQHPCWPKLLIEHQRPGCQNIYGQLIDQLYDQIGP